MASEKWRRFNEGLHRINKEAGRVDALIHTGGRSADSEKTDAIKGAAFKSSLTLVAVIHVYFLSSNAEWKGAERKCISYYLPAFYKTYFN